MFDFSEAALEQLAVHKVGNKSRGEGLIISPGLYELLDGNLEELLLKYFITPFKEKAVYRFHHETDIHLNEVYTYASAVFIDPAAFYEQSANIVRHLYETSAHPQIKEGEVYAAYFSGCRFGELTVDAIGIFKTENKENYLRVAGGREGFTLAADCGVNIRKLDKGAFIFNAESPGGYRVAVVDNVNKGNSEALYWKEEFLRVKPVEDEYFHTQNYLDMCRDFAENVYGPLCNADKKDQVVFMNEAIGFFDKNADFKLHEFVDTVLKEPELAGQFIEHQRAYEANMGLEHAEEFGISGAAEIGRAHV